jgi:hypothetical protein
VVSSVEHARGVRPQERSKVGDTMKFFSSQRRHAAPPPAAQPERPPESRTPEAGAPSPAPVLTDAAILTYLDNCLKGTARRAPRPGQLDLTTRVFELANDDWSEDQAAAELAWLARYDKRPVEALCHGLLAGLIRNPFPDVAGVRASRVAFRALQYCAATA